MATETVFSEHVTLMKRKSSSAPQLVLLYSWLFSQERHLRKYCDLYLDKGADVLVIKPTLPFILYPVKGSQEAASFVLSFLHSNPQYEDVFVHTLSTGGYVFGELLVKFEEDPERHGKIRKRIRGQIYDSCIDCAWITTGLARAVTKNMILQKIVSLCMSLYLKVMYKSSAWHYQRSSSAIHRAVCDAPALIFSSDDDDIAPPFMSKIIHDGWLAIGVNSTFKCWESSGHVCHLYRHREEYLQVWGKHMKNAGFRFV